MGNLIKDCKALSLYETIAELKVKYDLLEEKLKIEHFDNSTDKETPDEVDLVEEELKSLKEGEDRAAENIAPPKFGLS